MGKQSVASGQECEELVAAYLVDGGYEILDRNFRGGSGELDIVAEKGGKVYFVEVKARRAGSQVAAREAVTPDKRRRLMSAAMVWMQRRRGSEVDCSFLLAAVENADSANLSIHLIEDFLGW